MQICEYIESIDTWMVLKYWYQAVKKKETPLQADPPLLNHTTMGNPTICDPTPYTANTLEAIKERKKKKDLGCPNQVH